jgi:hypothetical protein
VALTLAAALAACVPAHQPNANAPGAGEPTAAPAGRVAEAPAATRSSAAAGASPHLPIAENTRELQDGAPNVIVRGSAVWVDDEQVADVSVIREGGRVQRVDGLYEKLKSLREAWQTANPGREFPGVVLHWFDQDLPALVVKSVLQTAAYAGYPHAGLAVRTPEDPSGVARLDAEAHLVLPPPPPEKSPSRPDPTLHVEMRPGGDFLLLWTQGAQVVRTVRVPHQQGSSSARQTEQEATRFPTLASAISRAWRAHGTRRAVDDPAFDRAMVHVDHSIPHRQIVAMLDAVYSVKRKMASGGAVEQVPAFRAVLATPAPPDRKLASHVPTDPTLAGASTVSGRLARNKIRDVVRANFEVFKKCYEAGLKKNPDLKGGVKVRFVVGRDGRVLSAAVQEQTLPDEVTVQCIVEAYKTLVFPRPEGGIVTVVYPIVFATE